MVDIHENFEEICLEIKISDLTRFIIKDIVTVFTFNGGIFARGESYFLIFDQKFALYSFFAIFHRVIMAEFSTKKGFWSWELKCLLCDNQAM